MRYTALACDYDGTLAWDGVVSESTFAALERLLASGRRLIMVTGRELPDLMKVFPRLDIFERIVAENGALLYRPSTRESRVIGEEPPKQFLAALKTRGVPFSLGNSIVATWTPHEKAVVEVIRNLGLELHVVFNKGSVMVLPSGVNKGTGLKAALMEMGLSPHNVIGVGDAENDHAFLALCEFSVAVSNALPMLKERADMITTGGRGDGVRELIDELLEDDLQRYESRLARHHVLLGERHDGSKVHLRPYGGGVLIAGPAGSGKSSATVGVLERLAGAGYQFCLIDSEGDYEAFDGSVTLGDAKHAPSPDEVLQLLKTPVESAVVNLLGISLGDRPEHFARLLPRFQEVRARAGRPHWLVLDEADHMLPSSREVIRRSHPGELGPVLMVTGHPGDIAMEALAVVDVVLAVGDAPEETLAAYAHALGLRPPEMPEARPASGEVVAWFRGAGDRAEIVRVAPARGDRRRHRRKYAEGDVGRESSFYFHGPGGRLNLRAQNLVLFMQIAEGVDDETWLHHLQRGDYSQWFRDAIKDDGLAQEVERIERMDDLSADASRSRVKAAIDERYTRPA